MSETNDQLILVSGFSGTGKSASLRNLRDHESWLYLNCESGKRLPFPNKFEKYTITDPYQVPAAFDYAMSPEGAHIQGIIIDSVTFLMDMFESVYVLPAVNTMQAWSDFAQFFKNLMQQKVAEFGKPVIIMAHLLDTLDERNKELKTSVPVKGALKNNGIEAYFSTVVNAKKVTIKDLESYGSKLLEITEEEREVGYKHVFQTRITKGTTGERIRSPMGMFARTETYIDNDCQLLLDHLKAFYENV